MFFTIFMDSDSNKPGVNIKNQKPKCTFITALVVLVVLKHFLALKNFRKKPVMYTKDVMYSLVYLSNLSVGRTANPGNLHGTVRLS